MILTVTANAALDVTYRMQSLQLRQTNRVATVDQRAGGKGINTARTLQALGVASTITGFVGGAAGALVIQDLDAAGLAHDLVDRAGETRRTVTMLTDGDEPTIVNEPGAAATPNEWKALLDKVSRLLPQAEVLVVAGSTPPHSPATSYAALIELARAAGVPTVLDSSGEDLAAGLRARPTLVKPNLTEISELTGIGDPLIAARKIRHDFGCAVYVSLGSQGAVLDTDSGSWRGAAPLVDSGNAIGAGDACVAALATAVAKGSAWRESIDDAIALSAAAVRGRLAGDVDLNFYYQHKGSVVVEDLT